LGFWCKPGGEFWPFLLENRFCDSRTCRGLKITHLVIGLFTELGKAHADICAPPQFQQTNSLHVAFQVAFQLHPTSWKERYYRMQVFLALLFPTRSLHFSCYLKMASCEAGPARDYAASFPARLRDVGSKVGLAQLGYVDQVLQLEAAPSYLYHFNRSHASYCTASSVISHVHKSFTVVLRHGLRHVVSCFISPEKVPRSIEIRREAAHFATEQTTKTIAIVGQLSIPISWIDIACYVPRAPACQTLQPPSHLHPLPKNDMVIDAGKRANPSNLCPRPPRLR
jgi:hypothetical protein